MESEFIRGEVKKIIELGKAKGFTEPRIAQQIDVTYVTLFKWKTNRGLPSSVHFLRLQRWAATELGYKA